MEGSPWDSDRAEAGERTEVSDLSQRMAVLKEKRLEKSRNVDTSIHRKVERRSPIKSTSQSMAVQNDGATLVYSSDDDDLVPEGHADMSAFADVLKEHISASTTENREGAGKGKLTSSRKQPQGTPTEHVEEYSGLRINYRTLSAIAVRERLKDVRIVTLRSFEFAVVGEGITGFWASVGILAKKDKTKQNAMGKPYAIWSISDLKSACIRLLVVGDAFTAHWKENEGSVVALINAEVLPAKRGANHMVMVKFSDQIMKLGTSRDFGICEGETKSGGQCSIVVDKSKGRFCHHHVAAQASRLKSARVELDGGNLGTAVLYNGKRQMVQSSMAMEELKDEKRLKASKALSKEEMQNLLKMPEKLTSRANSQGIRFLMLASGMTVQDLNPTSQDNNGVKLKQFRPGPVRPAASGPSSSCRKETYVRKIGGDVLTAERGEAANVTFCNSATTPAPAQGAHPSLGGALTRAVSRVKAATVGGARMHVPP